MESETVNGGLGEVGGSVIVKVTRHLMFQNELTK